MVELRPEESRGALQDLVGPAQLAVLPLELLHPLALLGRQAGPIAAVDLGLVDPQPERLRSDAELARDMGDGPVTITSLGGRLGHQPDRSFPQFRWISPLAMVAALCHDSMFLQTMESPPESGRFNRRAANLLARPSDPPGVIFGDVGELLRIRGKVAHGEPIPQKRWEDLYAARGLTQVMVEDRLAVLFDRWRDLVRRAILARLFLDDAGIWRIEARPQGGVDESLIDPIKRREWRRAVRRLSIELGIPAAIDPPPLRDTLHEPFSQGMEH